MYIPTNVPSNPAELPGFLLQELRRISQGTATPYLQLDVLHKAPAKPRDGMVVLADGTDWVLPGGMGVYCYYAGQWNKLG